VLRVTLNRLPGTFRRHVSTGRHQTRPERAGSASALKPSETNATIAGVLCRRSLFAYCGNQGVVIEIIAPAGDLVYRYVVRFANGTTDTFFGFELQLV